MAKMKTRQGILVLVDTSSAQEQSTRDFLAQTARENGFYLLQPQKDHIFMFGEAPEGLLGITAALVREDTPQLRLIAHGGFFQLTFEKDIPLALASAEKVNRFLEAHRSRPWDVLITHALFEGIKPSLQKQQLESQRLPVSEPIYGFDGSQWYPPFYTLSAARQESEVSDLLDQRLAQLKEDVQRIPVFGNIYEPVPMEQNFINLSVECDKAAFEAGIECDDDEYLTSNLWAEKYSDTEDGEAGEVLTGDLLSWDAGYIDDETEHKCRGPLTIEAGGLYEKFRKGIILGLPGAGKTTILRYITFREFRANEKKKGKDRQLVLFVPCRDIPYYDDWYREMYAAEAPPPYTENALEFFTWVFLFGTRVPVDVTPTERVEFRETLKKIEHYFKTNRLTLLVDALDEAPDMKTRICIKELFEVLISENRMFLTSRPTERVFFNTPGFPVFEVLSLTMEQVREMARHIMDENSEIYRQFDEAVWREELVVKMAATPITALLVTAYFQVYREFDLRYPMYDLLMKFILAKVWEHIKSDTFAYPNLELFFEAVTQPDFFDEHPRTLLFYRALASLCFQLFFESKEGGVQRSVNEETLKQHFVHFMLENPGVSPEEAPLKTAEQWIQRFYRDHLLLRSGPREYVFVHASVMEFLAAFHLVEETRDNPGRLPFFLGKCLRKREFLDIETVPIAAGSYIQKGLTLLEALRENAAKGDNEATVLLGIKCLAEVEWLIEKTLRALRVKSLEKSLKKNLERSRGAFDWLYGYLRDRMISVNKEQLKKDIQSFRPLTRLSRDTLLTEYLPPEGLPGDENELRKLREELFNTLVREDVLEGWRKRIKEAGVQESVQYDNVLRLDTSTYHPEDKNFNYYRKQIGPELTGFFGSPNLNHSDRVTSSAFSSDGNRFLTASYRILILWDANTGKELKTITSDNRCMIVSCAISSDGTYIVSAFRDGVLEMWDTNTGEKIRIFKKHEGPVLNCLFSADDSILISSSEDKCIKLWDIKSGKELRTITGNKNAVLGCAISLNGMRLLSADREGFLKLWDTATGIEIGTNNGQISPIARCIPYYDSSRLLTASKDRNLKLWDAATGKEMPSFPGSNTRQVRHMPSVGKNYFPSQWQFGKMFLREVTTGKVLLEFSGSQGNIRDLVLSADGSKLLSLSHSSRLNLYDTYTGKEILLNTRVRKFSRHIPSFRGLGCAFFTDPNRLLVVFSDGTLKQLDVTTRKEIHSYEGLCNKISSCVFSTDGRRMLYALQDSALKLLDTNEGKVLCTFNGHRERVRVHAISADTKRVFSASDDGAWKLWDASTGEEMNALNGHAGRIFSCAFSPDGERLLSASSDGILKLWDVGTGKTLRTFTGHKSVVSACTFSSDGKCIFSVSRDSTLKMWDTETGRILHSLELPWIPRRVAAAPDGRVFTANDNNTITVFEF